jgi:hypothetical protein
MDSRIRNQIITNKEHIQAMLHKVDELKRQNGDRGQVHGQNEAPTATTYETLPLTTGESTNAR